MAASPAAEQLPDFDVMLAEVGAKVARAMLGNSNKATVAARREEKSSEMRRLSSIVQAALGKLNAALADAAELGLALVNPALTLDWKAAKARLYAFRSTCPTRVPRSCARGGARLHHRPGRDGVDYPAARRRRQRTACERPMPTAAEAAIGPGAPSEPTTGQPFRTRPSGRTRVSLFELYFSCCLV